MQLEIVDMHFGTGALEVTQLDRDPYMLADYLHEIDTCHAHSKSVFFLALIGDGIGRTPLPTHIDADIYAAVLAVEHVTAQDKELLARWYIVDNTQKQQQHVLKRDYW